MGINVPSSVFERDASTRANDRAAIGLPTLPGLSFALRGAYERLASKRSGGFLKVTGRPAVVPASRVAVYQRERLADQLFDVCSGPWIQRAKSVVQLPGNSVHEAMVSWVVVQCPAAG